VGRCQRVEKHEGTRQACATCVPLLLLSGTGRHAQVTQADAKPHRPMHAPLRLPAYLQAAARPAAPSTTRSCACGRTPS
jgi:hypothetical protein